MKRESKKTKQKGVLLPLNSLAYKDLQSYRSSRRTLFGSEIMSIIIISGESSQSPNVFKSTCRDIKRKRTWILREITVADDQGFKRVCPFSLATFRLCSVKSSSLFLYEFWTSFAILPPNPHTSTSKIEASSGKNPWNKETHIFKSHTTKIYFHHLIRFEVQYSTIR